MGKKTKPKKKKDKTCLFIQRTASHTNPHFQHPIPEILFYYNVKIK